MLKCADVNIYNVLNLIQLLKNFAKQTGSSKNISIISCSVIFCDRTTDILLYFIYTCDEIIRMYT
jgi:hypothetical protein